MQGGAADGLRERLPRVVSEVRELNRLPLVAVCHGSTQAGAGADFRRRIAAEIRVINKKTGKTSSNVIPML